MVQYLHFRILKFPLIITLTVEPSLVRASIIETVGNTVLSITVNMTSTNIRWNKKRSAIF